MKIAVFHDLTNSVRIRLRNAQPAALHGALNLRSGRQNFFPDLGSDEDWFVPMTQQADLTELTECDECGCI